MANGEAIRFDPELAGKLAECDGGGPNLGGNFGYLEDFTGVLTGEYWEEGSPTWRWYRMVRLLRKPADYAHDEVWCEFGSLYPLAESSTR